MEISPSTQTDLSPNLPVVTQTRSIRVARFVSNVFCPPALAIYGILVVAATLATPAAWFWSGFEVFFGLVPSVGFILFQLKRGQVSDFEIYHREQRRGSYIFTLLSTSASIFIMWLFAAPILIISLLVAVILQVGLMFMINTRWKISAHASSMALFVTLLVFLYGRTLLPVTVGIPLMIWSRVSLRRHTLMQTIAGSLLGISILTLSWLFINANF
ncbi:MAG: phosphatase PAP2 family protein [Anaerolineae bacterium]|nr:phosphatase PAP2 family protein [Anaerolineae bacterium]